MDVCIVQYPHLFACLHTVSGRGLMFAYLSPVRSHAEALNCTLNTACGPRSVLGGKTMLVSVGPM